MNPERLIQNELNLSPLKSYAAILGASPSKGARSPKLWNAAFAKLGKDFTMVPMDIGANGLGPLLVSLKRDGRCIGGAVAVPHKELILPFLDQIEEEASLIGAVNAFYRRGDLLVGSNTDGAGAIASLKKRFDPLGKKAIVFGAGGAGKAVCTYLAKALGSHGELILINRTPAKAQSLVQKLSSFCHMSSVNSIDEISDLREVSLIVNCTSLGMDYFKPNEGYLGAVSPLGICKLISGVNKSDFVSLHRDAIVENFNQTLKILSSMNHPFIFDIVYQPETTPLLYAARLAGCETLGGREMNLEQAVIAFSKVESSASLETIRSAMLEVS